jgi:hypothetical protein
VSECDREDYVMRPWPIGAVGPWPTGAVGPSGKVMYFYLSTFRLVMLRIALCRRVPKGGDLLLKHAVRFI